MRLNAALAAPLTAALAMSPTMIDTAEPVESSKSKSIGIASLSTTAPTARTGKSRIAVHRAKTGRQLLVRAQVPGGKRGRVKVTALTGKAKGTTKSRWVPRKRVLKVTPGKYRVQAQKVRAKGVLLDASKNRVVKVTRKRGASVDIRYAKAPSGIPNHIFPACRKVAAKPQCRASKHRESGLTRDAAWVLRTVAHVWPQIRTVIGVRPDSLPDHPSGRALDLMMPSSGRTAADVRLGTSISNYLMRNAKRLGVKYVIWRGRIWNGEWESAKAWTSWRGYGYGGSWTAAHNDHVHVSFRTGYAGAAATQG